MRMINARTWASLREVVSSIYIICGHVFFPNVLKRWRIHNFESCIWGSDPRAAHFLKLVKEEIKLLWFLKPVRILHGKIRSWHLTCEVCGYSHCRFDPLIHAAWGRAVDTNQNWKKSSINLIIHIDHWNPFGIDKHFWQVCVFSWRAKWGCKPCRQLLLLWPVCFWWTSHGPSTLSLCAPWGQQACRTKDRKWRPGATPRSGVGDICLTYIYTAATVYMKIQDIAAQNVCINE